MKRLVVLLLAVPFALQASVIAVIDSGVDLKHEMLSSNTWTNEAEIADNYRDEDRNGYPDDVHGWNFAGQNSEIIDYSYLGTFNQDPYKYFEIQGRMFLGTATEEDLAWVKQKRNDPVFAQEMNIFGNFVHGTHVAGITAQNSPKAQVMGVKLLPTPVRKEIESYRSKVERFTGRDKDPEDGIAQWKMKLLKAGLGFLAVQQSTMLQEIGYYIGDLNARVANASFGTGYPQAQMIIGMFTKKASKEQMHELATYMINEMVKSGAAMMTAAPNTLYTIAAGNDGLNNDKFPCSPANIKTDNAISVAATLNRITLASFSNHGQLVDVAAPGVIVRSSIPGDEYLQVSGTSQAAPYVANVAGKVFDVNPALTPLQVKKIILGTVDKKDWLKGKVSTEGIVNPNRAIYAARLSIGRVGILSSLIQQSRDDIFDIPVVTDGPRMTPMAKYNKPVPLTNLFTL